MTSVDETTWLVNEFQSKQEKSDPRLTKNQNQKEKYHLVEQFDETFIQTAKTYFGLLNLSTGFVFKLSSLSCVIVNVAISSTFELLKTNMASTRNKRLSNRRLVSHLDDFDGDVIIGNTAGETQENIVVNEGTNDRDFTVGTSSDNLVTNENTVNVKTLERCFNERIDREKSNIVETVEDRFQNAILTAIDIIVAHKIEWAIRSINESSERDATSVTAISERGNM